MRNVLTTTACSLVILLAACSSQPPANTSAAFHTVADATVQSDVMQTIYLYERAVTKTDLRPKLMSARFVEKRGEIYTEKWVVQTNGVSATYDVQIQASPRGGVDFSVGREPPPVRDPASGAPTGNAKAAAR